MGQTVAAKDSVDSYSKHDEWLKGALGIDIQIARPKNTSAKEPETPEQAHRRELEAQVDKRHAERDARVDEYGIAKPAVSWTTKIADDVGPPEIMNDPSTPWYEQIGRAAVAGVGAAIYGHAMDNISPVDTRGDWHVPVPLLGEIAHGEAEAEYERKRAAYEEKLKKQEEAENQTPEEDDAQEPAENGDAQSKADDDGEHVCDPNSTNNAASDADSVQPVCAPDQALAPEPPPVCGPDTAAAPEPQPQVYENPNDLRQGVPEAGFEPARFWRRAD